MKSPKQKAVSSVKSLKQAHTSNGKTGLGDYNGAGVRQPMGKIRDMYDTGFVKNKSNSKPPKSLA
jgi:hypothetical protein